MTTDRFALWSWKRGPAENFHKLICSDLPAWFLIAWEPSHWQSLALAASKCHLRALWWISLFCSLWMAPDLHLRWTLQPAYKHIVFIPKNKTPLQIGLFDNFKTLQGQFQGGKEYISKAVQVLQKCICNAQSWDWAFASATYCKWHRHVTGLSKVSSRWYKIKWKPSSNNTLKSATLLEADRSDSSVLGLINVLLSRIEYTISWRKKQRRNWSHLFSYLLQGTLSWFIQELLSIRLCNCSKTVLLCAN